MPLLTAIARPHRRVTPATDPLNNPVLSPGGVLAWWKGDEAVGATTLLDYSGNGFNATYNLSANLTQRATPLRTGSAGSLLMTGNSYAASITSIPAALQIATTLASTCTMVVFCNKTTAAGNNFERVFGYGPGSLSNENGPTIGYLNKINAYGLPVNGGTRLVSPNNTAGTTVCVAYVKNGTNYTLYENGTSVATGTISSISQSYSTIEFLGTTTFASTVGYLGGGSDFIIYSGALNSTQLTAIAHAGGLV